MNPKAFFAELKRRNVYKVAVAYVVAGWALAQGIAQVFPVFDIPNWAVRLIVLAIVIGFPIALVVAWAFEITPEGIKRTEDVDLAPSRRSGNRAWIYVVLIGGAISVALFFLGRYTAPRTSVVEDERPGGPSLPSKSIAVLPFENLSGDPDNAYFAEGIQDEILARLSKIGELKVISRTSTQKYKSAPDNLREIAHQLGVTHILEGTVQKAAEQVRVNVQLINATTDAHLWAEIYDRKLTDIFDVESDIAKTIAETLKAKLTGSESHAVAAHPTENAEAYQLYLRGRYFLGKRTGDNLPKAIQYFEQAIAIDQRYALAYAGLADAYLLLPSYSGAPWKESLGKAKAEAKKALALDETLAEPHASLAEVFGQGDLDLARSLKEFRRAIELNSNYATAHSWYGRALLAAGRFDEAISEIRRSIELDPFSIVINSQLAYVYVIARRGDEAIKQARKTIEMEPSFYWGHSLLGRALQQKGDLVGAISEMEKARELDEDPQTRAWLAHAYAAAGRKDDTLKMVHELEDLSHLRPAAIYYLAIAHVALGEKEEALRLLEKSFAEPAIDMSGIKVDPLFDTLHGDPRFEALVHKIVAAK